MAYGFGITLKQQKLEELVETFNKKYLSVCNKDTAIIVDNHEVINVHMENDSYVIVANDKDNITGTRTIRRKSLSAAIKQIEAIFKEARALRWQYTEMYVNGRTYTIPHNPKWLSPDYILKMREQALKR